MNTAVRTWAAGIDFSTVYLSTVTISELSQWVALTQRRDPAQGETLNAWLRDSVLRWYDGRILPVDTEVALLAGRLHVPNPGDYRDAFVAATAVHHGLTVATRNVRDFSPMRVPLVNPFDVPTS
jgi:predicted nucleic acid-binding protein